MSSAESETKTRILEASLRLLKEKRGKNVRLEDVAKAAQVSRQAVYLHFKSRIGLMVATVQYGDEVLEAQKQVAPWRKATGVAKLDTWISFWGNYIPQIFGVAKALQVAKESDQAAAAAWEDRMEDVRRSCRTTVESLAAEGDLAAGWSVTAATDMLWALLSISNWEMLTVQGGWSNKKYVKQMQAAAKRMLVGSEP